MPKILPQNIINVTRHQQNTLGSSDLPSREDIPPDFKWKLSDIYESEDAWLDDFNKLKARFPELSTYKNRLAQDGQILLTCLKARDEIGIIGGKLYAFARMHRDENTAQSKYQAMTDKVESLLAEASSVTSFIEPEILAMDNNKLAELRLQTPALQEYNFYFDNLNRQKAHVLSPEEEALLSRLTEVTQASANTFNMLAHADIKFPQTTDENGKTIQLSESRYSVLIRSTDRNVRKQAFNNLFNTYKQFRNTFASTLYGNIKQNIFFSRARKYDCALEAALHPDNIPGSVYENVIQTVTNNLAPLHKYVELKQKALQLDEIHMYDLYTPLTNNFKMHIPYNEGVDLVKRGLAPLGEEYSGILNKIFASNWIDVYENKGKQSGAYSWGVYSVHPFILLNYNDRFDDVSTLAHEIGHAIHSYYSHSNQPYSTASYSIFCAEVASTTNEILLLDYVLNNFQDRTQKIYLLNQHLELIRATVYRQTMFAEFEKTIHEKAEGGEPITADMLEDLWQNLNRKFYGASIVVDDEITIEWARIPHFYSSFYVYQYVTGFSAATTLAKKILVEGETAQQQYIKFLKSGSSDYPLNLLKAAGVDMSLPHPIETTLNKFSQMLSQLDSLLDV